MLGDLLSGSAIQLFVSSEMKGLAVIVGIDYKVGHTEIEGH